MIHAHSVSNAVVDKNDFILIDPFGFARPRHENCTDGHMRYAPESADIANRAFILRNPRFPGSVMTSRRFSLDPAGASP